MKQAGRSKPNKKMQARKQQPRQGEPRQLITLREQLSIGTILCNAMNDFNIYCYYLDLHQPKYADTAKLDGALIVVRNLKEMLATLRRSSNSRYLAENATAGMARVIVAFQNAGRCIINNLARMPYNMNDDEIFKTIDFLQTILSMPEFAQVANSFRAQNYIERIANDLVGYLHARRQGQ